MDFLNVSAFSTSASTTKVLVLDGNTVKSRTAAQVVTDGGGSSGGGRSFDISLFGATKYAISDSFEIFIADGYDSGGSVYGWPYNGTDSLADSESRAYKTIIPFNPTAYRFTVLVYDTITYSGTTPSSGTFGVEFEYSTNNSTWTSFATVGFRTETIGTLVTVNGTLSISGSPSLVYIRAKCHNDLNNNADGSVLVRAFNASFWN